MTKDCHEILTGYKGNVTRVCEAEAQAWSAPVGTCVEKTCPRQIENSDGALVDFPETAQGSGTITITCPDTHEGKLSLDCNPDVEQWSNLQGECVATCVILQPQVKRETALYNGEVQVEVQWQASTKDDPSSPCCDKPPCPFTITVFDNTTGAVVPNLDIRVDREKDQATVAGLYPNKLYKYRVALDVTYSDTSPSQTKDWGRPFDVKGWNGCDQRAPGSQSKYVRGLVRTELNILPNMNAFCGVDRSTDADGKLECYDAEWDFTFDRKGLSQCADGYFITGFYKNSCNELSCVEKARCCRSSTLKPTSFNGECKMVDVTDTFDKAARVGCPQDYFVAGLERSDGMGIGHIEKLKCCKSLNNKH
jgi:hypothetical protein